MAIFEEEAHVGVTGSCAEVIRIAVPGDTLLDFEEPLTYEDLASMIDEFTEPVAAEEFVDTDQRGDDKLAV